ncbi:MAG: ScpA family protein [Mycobacteriales bacterium]
MPGDALLREPEPAFEVHLDVFSGPFDLLLGLIAKHQLDVTEVALSQVTDEFIAHIRFAGEWDLGAATDFLVVAATLLDLKAARLLPAGDVDDEDDVALLEARDLLFARLLQYRAYKEAARELAELMSVEAAYVARSVALEPAFAAAVPDVALGLSPGEFAALAWTALQPRPAPAVDASHVHLAVVSVAEHAAIVAERLRAAGSASFRALVADCRERIEVVARFLAALELYRDGLAAFDQVEPLGELRLRWVGSTEPETDVTTAEGQFDAR